MKWLFRILLVIVGVFLVMMGIGYYFKKEWSKSVDTLKVKSGELHFEAKRDETGVWIIKAPNEDSLFFGVGYVQAVDREFQTEALRMVAQGRGSELLGKDGLPFSRMMRFSSKVAEDEWEHRDPKRGLYRALQHYADGRNQFLKDELVPPPVEFKLLGLDRAKITPWTGLDVLKVARYHTWEFSYDYSEVLRDIKLKELAGEDFGRLLMMKEPHAKSELYSKAKTRGRIPQMAGQSLPSTPKTFFDFIKGSAGESKSAQNSALSNATFWEPTFGGGLPKGASNLWIVADPEKMPSPTFCNDTHLKHFWPSSLYPVRYEIANETKAAGFMLPGIPFLTVGSLDHPQARRKMVWGITIATFADVQDLIQLSPSTMAKTKKFQEKYVIHEPLAEKSEEIEIQEEWTSLGPRVDGIVPWLKGHERKNIALDWLGFRKMESPMEFFYRRTLKGEENVEGDLAQTWTYPSVNFVWMSQQASNPIHFGHSVTGIIFKGDHSERKILSESDAQKRSLSFPSQRPLIHYDYHENESFLLATGNQKVFDDTLSEQLAYDWIDTSRADRIYEVLDADPSKVEEEQGDAYIPTLVDFVKSQRKKFSVDELCSYTENREECIDRVTDLDSWDGRGTETSTATPLAAMWYMESRWAMLPTSLTQNFATQPKDTKELLLRWVNSPNAMRLVRSMIQNKEYRESWEKVSGRKWNDVVKAAFTKSVSLIGPASEFLNWGVLHRISWFHPIGKVPGEFGKLLKESLLGSGPFVQGGFDSPGRSDISWDPEDPLMFPNTHGSAMRMCRSFLPSKGGHDKGFRWTNVTGPSGNPYSPWSRKFAEDYYQKNKLFRVEGF